MNKYVGNHCGNYITQSVLVVKLLIVNVNVTVFQLNRRDQIK